MIKHQSSVTSLHNDTHFWVLHKSQSDASVSVTLGEQGFDGEQGIHFMFQLFLLLIHLCYLFTSSLYI